MMRKVIKNFSTVTDLFEIRRLYHGEEFTEFI